MTFYDAIAGRYDDITGAARREDAAGAFAAEVVGRYKVRSALDAACGTGLYTLAMAAAGARIVGSDISEAMLVEARRHAAASGLDIRWVQAPMQEVADHVEGPFDAVLCLGNSLPHLLRDADLDATLAGFARLVGAAGVVILHVLNYARILARRERIIHIDRRGECEYVRFYDFLDDRVRFNILEILWEGDTCRHRLNSTEHRPWQAEALVDRLRRHGLSNIDLFGDMQFAPYRSAESPALVLVARTTTP